MPFGVSAALMRTQPLSQGNNTVWRRVRLQNQGADGTQTITCAAITNPPLLRFKQFTRGQLDREWEGMHRGIQGHRASKQTKK